LRHRPHLAAAAAAAAAAGVVAGGELFEHDLAISAISTVNASLTPSDIRRRVRESQLRSTDFTAR